MMLNVLLFVGSIFLFVFIIILMREYDKGMKEHMEDKKYELD